MVRYRMSRSSEKTDGIGEGSAEASKKKQRIKVLFPPQQRRKRCHRQQRRGTQGQT